MTLRYGFGSGLAIRAGDPPGHVWAIGDRGPNIKVRDIIGQYGLDELTPLLALSGAKIMPRPDIGPTLAELRVEGDSVTLVRMVSLTKVSGQRVSGLANPGSENLLSEPVFDLAGTRIAADPEGLDTEGLVALSDGGFWIGDEFGPSLVRLDAQGMVVKRLPPRTMGKSSPVDAPLGLPPIAAKRQLNRGFEALTISSDERWLFLAFQSPLAHPDEDAHEQARHVRLWRMDADTGRVAAQYAYPLDCPDSFARDRALGAFERRDIKVSELLWVGPDTLLVLERGSATTKIYSCVLESEAMLADEHLNVASRPTLEELSAVDKPMFPVLVKTLVFTSDDFPELGADVEGMALLSPTELLLVTDNDFGVTGATTQFWRVRLPKPSGPQTGKSLLPTERIGSG
ncbi:esterase-like activity of phytase family protein [Sphingomonas sp. CFBP 13720]|uniref:esterase-like activity of phytase family protein n=1 Tax=Sphingomonas sp. CFBP 13720 TaxID=2775302 RepID=UPI00177CEFB8|nr:esterase-like activity of phytase family protein [Sphingomonas sp. CFBP 13720]MBD8680078.1 esterase-like activity of phytase family protein [Sphingomonas sp. CFBP 13720]